MDGHELRRLTQRYSQMTDSEIIEILLEDEQAYLSEPYESYTLLLNEARKRGLETLLEIRKHSAEPPGTEPRGPADFVVVASGPVMKIGMAQGLLEHNHIPYFIENETLGTLAAPYVSSGGLHAVKILVEKKNAEKAKTLLNDYWEES